MKTRMDAPALRLWLIVISLLLIAAVHLTLAAGLSRVVTDRLLQREGEVAREFLNSVIRAEDSGSHLFDTPAPSPALASFSAHVQSLPGTVRANIYSLDGFIRYSTDAKFIGLQFRDNAEVAEAAGGKLIAKLETVADDDKPEHLAMNRHEGDQLVEAYIPVSDPAGKTVAVVEFYREPGMVQAIVDDIGTRIWLAAGLSGAILFGAIVIAISFGTRRMA